MKKKPQELRNFLNERKQVKSWPSKPGVKMLVLRYLIEQFEWDKKYSEQEVYSLLNEFHTFEDPALLRRELYMKQFMDRVADGSAYWRMPKGQ